MLAPGTLQSVWDIAASALENDPPLCLVPLLMRQMDLVEGVRQAIADIDVVRAFSLYSDLVCLLGHIVDAHAAEEARLETRLDTLHTYARSTTSELGWLLSRMTEADDLGAEMDHALKLHAYASGDILKEVQ